MPACSPVDLLLALPVPTSARRLTPSEEECSSVYTRSSAAPRRMKSARSWVSVRTNNLAPSSALMRMSRIWAAVSPPVRRQLDDYKKRFDDGTAIGREGYRPIEI